MFSVLVLLEDSKNVRSDHLPKKIGNPPAKNHFFHFRHAVGWWWGREQKWHWCQVEGIAKWHRTRCANNKQQQLREQAIRQGGRRVHWSIQLFQGGRMWRLRGNGFSKVAKLRQRRRTCTLRPSGLTIAFIFCCEARDLLFIRKTQSDAVLMSPATDMNFQCICSSCRYELNYQIFDSHANHLENLEGSKRRRSH